MTDVGFSLTERPLNLTIIARVVEDTMASLNDDASPSNSHPKSGKTIKVVGWVLLASIPILLLLVAAAAYFTHRHSRPKAPKSKNPKNKKGLRSLQLLKMDDLFYKTDKNGNTVKTPDAARTRGTPDDRFVLGSEAELGVVAVEAGSSTNAIPQVVRKPTGSILNK